MKYNYLIISLFACFLFGLGKARAQTGGAVHTICGPSSSTTVDGVPAATAGGILCPQGIAIDAMGNLYITEHDYSRVRKIDAFTGLIYTIVGNNTYTAAGFTGDGGLATNARIDHPMGLCLDHTGNLYIADYGNGRVRKVDAATHNISTIAGGGTSLADGVPATNDTIRPQCVYVDAAGNVYTGSDNKVRKINTSGIITTIAGTGVGTETGDGGFATNATLNGTPKCIASDFYGNIYFLSNSGNKVRRIDAITGIVTTVAGGGSSSADGIPATAANIGTAFYFAFDQGGNIFVSTEGGNKIRRVDAYTGLINTIGGGGTLTTEGIPATASYIRAHTLMADAVHGYIYYAGCTTSVRRFDYPLGSGSYSGIADSFVVILNRHCTGPEIRMSTPNYIAGRSMKTFFGDGLYDSSTLTPGVLSGGGAIINHAYNSSGTYTIRHILYLGSIVVDTLSYTYTYTLCRSFPFRFYYDQNSNCIKDSSEKYLRIPILTEVDSNGIAIDTVSATSGFTYNAYGSSGDVFKFSPLNIPGHLVATCPSTGFLSDTIQSSISAIKYFGMECTGTSAFDLGIASIVHRTGRNTQTGQIYVGNNLCAPTDAVVTLNFSPKYEYSYALPSPSSTSATSITWNLTGLSSYLNSPARILYKLNYNHTIGLLTIGDTVMDHINVSPTIGDVNPADNSIIFVDTVRASFDPNEIWVSPSGCLSSGILPNLLTYTINFENTGTDTAFNIYVLDTLPYYVDAKSLRIVNSSADMFVDIETQGSQKVVKFDFPNINLLDSSHHGECNGSVIFTVNTLAGLATGTNITNRAGIYFDYNDVVMTNSVTNTIGCPRNVEVPQVGAKDNISIYPNPTTGIFTIKTPKDDYTTLTITNSIGQLLLTEPITNSQTTINVNTLAPGLYYLTLKGDSGVEVRKFVKEEYK